MPDVSAAALVASVWSVVLGVARVTSEEPEMADPSVVTAVE